jgi:hypothetical protein
MVATPNRKLGAMIHCYKYSVCSNISPNFLLVGAIGESVYKTLVVEFFGRFLIEGEIILWYSPCWYDVL